MEEEEEGSIAVCLSVCLYYAKRVVYLRSYLCVGRESFHFRLVKESERLNKGRVCVGAATDKSNLLLKVKV